MHGFVAVVEHRRHVRVKPHLHRQRPLETLADCAVYACCDHHGHVLLSTHDQLTSPEIEAYALSVPQPHDLSEHVAKQAFVM